MTAATARSGRSLLLAVAPLLLAAAVLVTQRPALTTDTGFRVTAPLDGARVSGPVTLAWTSAAGASSYAVVVDTAPPVPGAAVHPGTQVVTLDGKTVRLVLGHARSGSASARRFHTVRVIPVDGEGRRRGEDVAVVHVHVTDT